MNPSNTQQSGQPYQKLKRVVNEDHIVEYKGVRKHQEVENTNRKIRQETPNILFLQETKCCLEGLVKIKDKIWKVIHLMALDATGKYGGVAIFWQPRTVELSD